MINFFKNLGKWPILLIAGMVTVLLMGYFQMSFSRHLPEGAPAYAGLQLSPTVDEFSAVLAQWGPENILRYQQSMWADFVFPLSYAVLFTGLLVLTGTRREITHFEQAVWFAPALAALMDYVENILHVWLLTKGSPYSAQLVSLACNASMVKWVLLGGLIPLTLLWGIVQTIFRKQSEKKNL